MEKYFLDRFKNKTKDELQGIIDNSGSYQPAALNAAIQLLNEKIEIPIPLPNSQESANSRFEDSNTGNMPFGIDYRPFLRTLSYREFLTSFTLALLYQAFHELLKYYSDERIFENSYKNIQLILLIVLILANHVYYKFEHKRSNNFSGRIINDIIFLTILLFTKVIYELIKDSSYSFSINVSELGLVFFIIGLVILLFGLELLFAVLKYLLNLIMCRIF